SKSENTASSQAVLVGTRRSSIGRDCTRRTTVRQRRLPGSCPRPWRRERSRGARRLGSAPSPPLFAEKRDEKAPDVGPPAMLPQVERLPGAERETPATDRHGLARAGERRSGMRRHVVRPLVVVLPTSALGSQLLHPPGEVPKHPRIRVLLNHE